MRDEAPQTPFERNKRHWPHIDEDDIKGVLDVLRKGQISIIGETGIIDEMRRLYAEHFGVKYVVPQNSGTATLHSAYFALALSPGDEVIVPSATFHSTASAIFHTGARPVFCEIDPSSL